ncbi:MAG: hypothetical protein ACI8RZ_000400 [Myxococcota bacterium]|jgi:hypothetical protein
MVPPLVSSILVLLSCTGEYVYDSADPEPPKAGRVIELVDDHNYAYDSTIDVPEVATAAETDLILSWAGLTEDMQCHETEPVSGVDNVAVLVFANLTQDEVAVGLNDDTLQQADLSVYISAEPGNATNLDLSELTFYGTDPEILPFTTPDSGTWLALLTSGTQIAVGTRAMKFFSPTKGETNTTVAINDACGMLEFAVELEALEEVPVNVEGPWIIDWSALTRSGQGYPINLGNIDRVMVAWFADQEVAGLETNFLDLELVADRLWSMELDGGAGAELDGLKESGTDAAFDGFTEDGLWLLALRCSTCPNPAPQFLTVVYPLAEG